MVIVMRMDGGDGKTTSFCGSILHESQFPHSRSVLLAFFQCHTIPSIGNGVTPINASACAGLLAMDNGRNLIFV